MNPLDVAIIGAGHNALVTACYLAQHGHRVSIYEGNKHIGGLCANKEIWPGFTVSMWSNWSGMFLPLIQKDLNLKLPDLYETEDVVLTSDGGGFSANNFYTEDISQADVEGIERLEKDALAIAQCLKKQFLAKYPNKEEFIKDLQGLKLPFLPEDMMKSSVYDVVKAYVSNPKLWVALSYESYTHPMAPGSFYGYMHMRIPLTYSERPFWGIMKGGLGHITSSLEIEARKLGVEIYTEKPVEFIESQNLSVTSLLLENGERIKSDIYICGTDYPTLQKLLRRPEKRAMRHYKQGHSQIHFKLSALPEFKTLLEKGIKTPSSLTLSPSIEQLESGYKSFVAGDTVEHPILSVMLPSVKEKDRFPSGSHIMTVFVDHTPLKQEKWTLQEREGYVNIIINFIEQFAPQIKDCIQDWHFINNDDIQESVGAGGGHCFHGDISWEFALNDRMPEYGAGPETDLENLYLCGSSCSPGGTVSGAPGYRCAQALLNN